MKIDWRTLEEVDIESDYIFKQYYSLYHVDSVE